MVRRDKSEGSQDYIDENLKRVFQETLDEDIPDRFRNLLDKLRDREASGTAKAAKEGK